MVLNSTFMWLILCQGILSYFFFLWSRFFSFKSSFKSLNSCQFHVLSCPKLCFLVGRRLISARQVISPAQVAAHQVISAEWCLSRFLNSCLSLTVTVCKEYVHTGLGSRFCSFLFFISLSFINFFSFFFYSVFLPFLSFTVINFLFLTFFHALIR